MTDRASVGVLHPVGPLGDAAPDIASASDYFSLLKPRVMSLVIFTGLVGLVLAPGTIHPVLAVTGLLCIALGAGAAGALNMWYDADIDVGMERTRNRPIPAGRVAPGAALGFGATLAVASVVTMGLTVNLMSAALLAATIGFYVFIYTMWLKRRTPQNIVIGGAAGALPPVVGWAVVTGSVGLPALVLFAIIFMWTPPHFWALALVRSGEYKRVGVPMLPVVAGPDATRRQIVLYSFALVPVTLLPWIMGFAGALYGWLAVVLGAVFLAGAIQVWRVRVGPAADAWATRLFGFSIAYLFLLFATLLVEHGLGIGA